MICMFKTIDYCYQMYLRTFENMCLEIFETDPARFITSQVQDGKQLLKKSKVKLDLLTDMDMLLINMLLYLSIYKSGSQIHETSC